MSVSVIIPCYNNEPFVAEAIDSALSQSVPGVEVEVVVVDDGSTDGSAGVIRNFSNIKFVSQPNSGVSTARNNGAKIASGSHLVFLDADDRLAPDAIRAHLDAFRENPRRVFVFGVCDIIDERGLIIKPHRQDPGICDYWDILLGITPNPSQCMLRRTEFEQIGGFDASLAYGEDWDCFMRLSRMGESYCHGVVVADYRKHPNQSTRKPSKILSNMLDIIDSHRLRYGENETDLKAFKQAKLHYTHLYGKWVAGETVRHIQGKRYRPALQSAAVFLGNLPHSARGLYGFIRSRRSGG